MVARGDARFQEADKGLGVVDVDVDVDAVATAAAARESRVVVVECCEVVLV